MPLYNLNGAHVAAAGGNFDLQTSNLGIIELHLENFSDRLGILASAATKVASATFNYTQQLISEAITQGVSDTLLLGLRSFNMPERQVERAYAPYLNGGAWYLTKPTPMDVISCTFYDSLQGGQRKALVAWSMLAYDEETGLMLLPSDLKVTADILIFGTDRSNERQYHAIGVMPLNRPPIGIDYTGDGSSQPLEMALSIDRLQHRKL